MPDELKTSPYYYLFKDPDFRRWFYNVKRGSANTAYEWFRRFGRIHKRFGKMPKDFVKMGERKTVAFMLDMVTELESEKKSGSYISNNVKPIKNWMSFNGITIDQRIKISRRNDLVTVDDEKIPMQEELRKIFNAGTFRGRAASSLVSFSGFRPESLGDFLGEDGLVIEDFPEMIVAGDEVRFAKIPTMAIVRKNLSKAGHQYFTFYPVEGCEYLKQYLEWRVRKGDKLKPESPIITQDWWKGNPEFSGHEMTGPEGHLRTVHVSDVIRTPIRRAGFKWRPYVLRRYFDTRLMVAEMDGLIIRDFRVFWMGHKGDIEHTYTLNKAVPEDVINRMRAAYAKASEKHLMTFATGNGNMDAVKAQMNIQFLMVEGYTKEEIDAMSIDLSTLTPEDIERMGREKRQQKLEANKNNQKVIPADSVEEWIAQGWEFVTALPKDKAIIRLPK